MSAFSRARAKVKKFDREEQRAGHKLYDDYLSQAHEMVRGLLHIDCGALPLGTPGHHPLEVKIAQACVAAFHRGKNARRG